MTELCRSNVGNTGYGDYVLGINYSIQSQNQSSNYSTINAQVWLYCPVWISFSRGNFTLTGDFNVSGSLETRYSAGTHILWSGTFNVGHDNEGNKNLNLNASISTTYALSGNTSGTVSLPNIARYAMITNFKVNKKDETSVTFEYSTNTEVDYAWCSKDNGTTWQNLENNHILFNLDPGVEYSFKLRVRRKDNGLLTDSDTYKQSTYHYPYIKSVSKKELGVGEEQVVEIYNPLKRSITFKMRKDHSSGTLLYEKELNGTSLIFTPSLETLYQSLDSSTSSNCIYQVVYSPSNITSNLEGYSYLVDVNECLPIFNDFEYQIVDDVTVGLTRKNNIALPGLSTCRIIINNQNKALGTNYATISSYRVDWGNITNSTSYSDPVSMDISSGTESILKVTAIDSRGLQRTVSKKITMINYVGPIINKVNVSRKNGVENETYLELEATIWNGTFPIGFNEITYFAYRTKPVNGNWSVFYDKTDLFKSSISSKDGKISLKDFLIHENGFSNGFSTGTSYLIEVMIKDGYQAYKLESALFSQEITDGHVASCVHQKINGDYCWGFNTMSDDQYGLLVKGKIAILNEDGSITEIGG